jgi:ATP-dependent helicase/nuclease subunit B
MPVRLFVAPAGHGKTAYAIETIRALPPLSPVRILVPDQIQVAAFRRRLARAGGALGVEVQTFYGLYAHVLTLAGGSLTLPETQPARGMARLPPAVLNLLIQHIVDAQCDAGRLSYYAPLSRSPGFARLLGRLFGEFKRARAFPEDLTRLLAESEPRLAELARLYAAYQGWLLDTGWIDADGQGWLAAIALEQNPPLLSDLSLLVVDGFDEFNPTQLHLLGLLSDRAADTLITLIGDPGRPDRLAHRRLARAREILIEMLDIEWIGPVAQAPVPGTTYADTLKRFQQDRGTERRRASALSHLEANLFEPHTTSVPAADTVTFIEAQNRASEAREALRWLKACLVRERVPLSDVAVIARDVTPYRLFLDQVAAEFGLPLRFVAGTDLQSNPAIAALLNLLTLTLDPDAWSPRSLLDALTSPYLSWAAYGLQPGDADRLYDVAHAGQVVSGLDQWRAALRHLAASAVARGEEALPPDYEEDDWTPQRPLAAAEVTQLEAVIEAIAARITPPPWATLRDWVLWLEELLGEDPTSTGESAPPGDEESLHVVACARENPATAERDGAALRAFKDILRALVLADSVLGGGRDDALPYDQFVAGLIQALKDATFSIPVQGEAITVASAGEARGLTFDAVALLGLSEGDFPHAEREDPLLRELDRAWLAERGFAIEPRLQGDEATFFYQAVTRARRRLLVCRPYLADDGQPWEASPYWPALKRLFDDASVTHIRPTDPVSDVASQQELVHAVINDAASDAVAILHARAQAEASPWNGDLSALEERLTARFGPDQPWSSSRLETYAKCPFYFWAAYAMELEPRELPQIGFDVLILGSIYHLVLEKLYGRVPDGDADRLRAELPLVAREVYDAAPNDYGFRPTPLWERQQVELTQVLRRTVDALIEAAAKYEPLIQELPFGLRGHPPLVLGREPPLRLRGYIDRVDRAPDGRLRIIDYKAGSSPISARDLSDGHRLQLPLYALAAQEALDAPVASGFYWHIGSAKPSSLKLERYVQGVSGAIETAVDYALAIAAAVRAGQFAPTPPDGGCPPFCPAATFCERFVPRLW